MTEPTTPRSEQPTVLELSPDEVQLLRTALRLLRATLGHDEAEELREVEALLRRLPAA